MKNNIKKAPVMFREDQLYFQHFMLILSLPKISDYQHLKPSNFEENLFTLYSIISLFQSVTQTTHFTEKFSSLIEFFVTNKENLKLSGVGEPFVNQELSFYCPVYGILKISKQKHKTFTRHTWNYEHGNHSKMSLLRPLEIKTTSLLRPVFASPKWYFPYDISFDIKTTPLIRSLLGSSKGGLYIWI